MGLISKAIMAGGAYYAYKKVIKSVFPYFHIQKQYSNISTRAQEERNVQHNMQREMDPNHSHEIGDESFGKDGSHGSFDGLVQIAQDVMGKGH
jgi:hypothetical protein